MAPRRLLLPHATVDLDLLEVRRAGAATSLTPLEARLLGWLAAHADRVVPRDELLVEVWGYRPGVKSRAVDNTVSRLRGKIELDPALPSALLSAPGAGYRLVLGARRTRPEGLPAVTSLVGREALLAEVATALRPRGAWVTLHGPGGVGKTALAVATAHAHDDAAEVVWVDLTGATTPAEVAVGLAAALGIHAEVGWDALGEALSHRDALVVLDNLDDVAPKLASMFPPRAECARWLCTSRVPVGGERTIPVPLLPARDASALYLALSGLPDHPLVGALVERLDGLPLAIRLAAARARVLPPAALLDRLDRDVLAGPEDGRHRSLWSAIRCSLDSLPEPLRASLHALALLPGTFALEHAEAAAVPPAHLEELVARSLVEIDAPADSAEFRLLDQVRACVVASPGPAVDPWPGLRAWFLGQAPGWWSAPGTPAEAGVLRRLGRERRLLEAVLERTPEGEEQTWLAMLLDLVLATRGPAQERLARLSSLRPTGSTLDLRVGLRLADALAQLGRREDALARLGALPRSGEVALARHRLLANMGRLDEAEAALAEAGADHDPACALERAAFLRRRGRAVDARAAYRSILPILVSTGPSRAEAEAHVGLSQVLSGPLDLPEAAAHVDRALAIYRLFEDQRGEQAALTALGLLRFRLADWTGAREALAEAADRHRRLGQPGPAAMALSHLGVIEGILGEIRVAERHLAEAISAHEAGGRPPQVAVCLGNLAALRVLEDRLPEAQGLFRRALALLTGAGSSRVASLIRAQAAIVDVRLGHPPPVPGTPGDPYEAALVEVASAWAESRGSRAERARAHGRVIELRRGGPEWEPWVAAIVGRQVDALERELQRRGEG